MLAHARSLRLTNQSKYDARAAGRKGTGPAGSYYETMTEDDMLEQEKDKQALELAMKMIMRDPRRAEQIKGKLEGVASQSSRGLLLPTGALAEKRRVCSELLSVRRWI